MGTHSQSNHNSIKMASPNANAGNLPGDNSTVEHWPVGKLTLVEEIDMLKSATVTEPTWGSNEPYCQLSGAKSATFRRYSSNVREVDILHQTLQGVTPADVIWFIQRLGMYVRRADDGRLGVGSEMSVYRLWHQRDHVRVFRGAGDRPGKNPEFVIDENAQFRIQEVLLLKHPTPIDIVQEVVQFDEDNFAFVMVKNGVRIASLEHFMRSTNGGKDTEFRTRMRIGRPGNILLNSLLPIFLPDQFLYDWALHNVEETGNTSRVVGELKKLKDSDFVKVTIFALVLSI